MPVLWEVESSRKLWLQLLVFRPTVDTCREEVCKKSLKLKMQKWRFFFSEELCGHGFWIPIHLFSSFQGNNGDVSRSLLLVKRIMHIIGTISIYYRLLNILFEFVLELPVQIWLERPRRMPWSKPPQQSSVPCLSCRGIAPSRDERWRSI